MESWRQHWKEEIINKKRRGVKLVGHNNLIIIKCFYFAVVVRYDQLTYT